jgi:hypothetical protein
VSGKDSTEILFWSWSWFLTFREELRVFENRMLSGIFGSKRDDVTGEWRNLYNNDLRDLYSSPSEIRMMRTMRWVGHVAQIRRRGTRVGY